MVKKRVLLFTYLFLAVFCTVSLILFTLWENSYSSNNFQNKDLLDDSWNVSINDSVSENVSLSSFSFPSMPENSPVLLENTLPSFMPAHPSLWIQTVYSGIEVRIDGEKIYSYGLDLHEQEVNVGCGFHVIPLSENDKRKEIQIALTITQKNAFSAVKPILIQPSAEIIPGFLGRSLLPFTTSIFLIMLGTIGSLVCIGALFLKKKILTLLALSQFSFWVGVGVLTNTDLIQLFSQNFTFNSYLEYTALYATVFSLMVFFFLSIAKTKIEQILTAIVSSAFIVYCAAAIILERFHFLHLPETLLYYQIICLIMIAFSFAVCLYKIIAKTGRTLFSSLSFTFLLFLCGLDLGRYALQKYFLANVPVFYNSLLTIGVVIFIVSELLFYFITLEKEITGRLEFSDLQFTPSDYSFLASRKKIIQTVNELNKHHVYYTFISISFANVPNDEAAFKQYGKTITSLLKTVFDCYGLISYYDNNTFVIVVSEVTEPKLTQLINTFNQLLEYKSLKEKFPQVTTSIGYAYSYESSYKSFKAVFSLAQQRKKKKLLIS